MLNWLHHEYIQNLSTYKQSHSNQNGGGKGSRWKGGKNVKREERERQGEKREGRGEWTSFWFWNQVIYHEYKIGLNTCIYLVSRSYSALLLVESCDSIADSLPSSCNPALHRLLRALSPMKRCGELQNGVVDHICNVAETVVKASHGV